ncbi:MAG: Thioredoxin C-1 [Promethearchaeota archaeon]|nr:MAG: Thioredoxin C-1 [Candidatus Lokiarchaeota archaeon]
MNISKLEEVNIEIPDIMQEGKVIVDVYTEWCGPCKFIAPILEKFQQEGLIKVIRIDLDQNRPLGQMFGITAIPTLLFFNNGELIEQNIELDGRILVKNGIMVGAAGEDVMRQIIDQM